MVERIPADDAAEKYVLAAACRGFTEHLIPVVVPEMFHRPSHQLAWGAVVAAWERGDQPTVGGVRGELLALHSDMVEGLDWRELRSIAGHEWERNVERLQSAYLKRRLIELSHYADDLGGSGVERSGADVLAEFRSTVEGIEVPNAGPPEDLYTIEDFLAMDTVTGPWVIPGLLRSDWRVLLVGPEGMGKSVLLRQIAAGAAHGIHPLYPSGASRFLPSSVLLIDLENPASQLQRVTAPIMRYASGHPRGVEGGQLHLWHRRQGLDLRSPTGRREIEAVLRETRPKLVLVGPLYKLYRTHQGDNYETSAEEAQQILDDLRERFGFALVIEHHARKASGGNKRAMEPYGSSYWLRWPEFGIALNPEDREGLTMAVDRFRGDREIAYWPELIERSRVAPGLGWPWEPRSNTNEAFDKRGLPSEWDIPEDDPCWYQEVDAP